MEEVKANLRTKIALMKSDRITKIVSALGDVPDIQILKMVMEKFMKTLKLLVRRELIMRRDLLELGLVSLLDLDLS